MNRVIRNATLTAVPQAYGHGAPVLIDEYMAAVIEQARVEAFEAGRSEGFAAGREDMTAAAERVQTAVAKATADLVEMRASAVLEAIDTALVVAEFVMARAPHDDGEALATRIDSALGALDDEDLIVTIYPQDWDVVSSAVRLPNGVSMERDPSLRPGEARISGRWATADLTREAALAIAREALS